MPGVQDEDTERTLKRAILARLTPITSFCIDNNEPNLSLSKRQESVVRNQLITMASQARSDPALLQEWARCNYQPFVNFFWML
jgi:hypothetical protein